MRKFEWVLLLGLWLFPLTGLGQPRAEGAHRIRKVQFPQAALELLEPFTNDARSIRFYREGEGDRVGFATRFRKDRLTYRVDFDTAGGLVLAGLSVRPIDLPQEAWGRIQIWQDARFSASRVRDIWQTYPRLAFHTDGDTFRTAFQNLLVPQLRYEIVLQVRSGDTRGTYRAIFDSEGNFLELVQVAPPNHEHVLY